MNLIISVSCICLECLVIHNAHCIFQLILSKMLTLNFLFTMHILNTRIFQMTCFLQLFKVRVILLLPCHLHRVVLDDLELQLYIW